MLRALVLAAALVLPPVHGGFDYQLGGAYPPAAGVSVVTRDRTAAPAPGVYSICYVNAFQTQPEDDAWWRSRHPALLLHDAAGREVVDPGWPGELLLDTRTAAARTGIARIVGSWIAGCARKGFRAVEPDNLDSWTRAHGLLSAADNVALARLLVARAHAKGLAIAQKNAAELAPQGRAIGFDLILDQVTYGIADAGMRIQTQARARSFRFRFATFSENASKPEMQACAGLPGMGSQSTRRSRSRATCARNSHSP